MNKGSLRVHQVEFSVNSFQASAMAVVLDNIQTALEALANSDPLMAVGGW